MSWQDWLTGSPHLVTGYQTDDDPLSLGFVRDDHLRLTNGTIEDDYVRSLMADSLEMAQALTARSILPETYRLDLVGFPACIDPPFPPLVSVESIQYYDEDNTIQTVSTSVYQVHRPFGPRASRGSITLVSGQSWPTVFARPDAVQVTFRCGYVDTSVSPEVIRVPSAINRARLLIIKDLYEQRGSATVGVGTSVTPNIIRAQDMLWSFRDPGAAG